MSFVAGLSRPLNADAPKEEEPKANVVKKTPPDPAVDKAALDRVITMWSESKNTFFRNKWLGLPTLQNPMDVWVTQEIMFETKPDFIVEAGTFVGGSAALWATILAQINPKGRVITIDVVDRMAEARKLPIVKRHVDFLLGSSTDDKVVKEVKRRVKGHSAMVILDSLHTKEHVLNELHAYAPIIPVGGYLIVQDAFLNGHPAPEGWGPGPYEAVEEFLKESNNFVSDRDRERLMITFNPTGFLKRVK